MVIGRLEYLNNMQAEDRKNNDVYFRFTIAYTIWAAYRNDTNLTMQLCESHPSVINMADDHAKLTPFLLACRNGNTRLVRFMIDYGANLETTTENGENCFFLAVYERIKKMKSMDASCIHALYHAGADINRPNDYGLNALQVAALYGHRSLVKWLLSKNAEYNIEPTPYAIAKKAGHKTTAALILSFQLANC